MERIGLIAISLTNKDGRRKEKIHERNRYARQNIQRNYL